jgi:uncharacterized protein YdaL
MHPVKTRQEVHPYLSNKGEPVKKLLAVMTLVPLLLLAACGSPSPQALAEEQASGPQVIVLYDDATVGTLSSQSVQSQSVLKPGLLKPGLATMYHQETQDSDPDPESDNQAQPAAFGDVSAQSYSYTESAQIYAIMLANLLGRYNVEVVRKPVSSYQAGDAEKALRTFYIGSTYGNPIPDGLVNDARSGAAITWINYQIWKAVPFSNEIVAPSSPLGFSFTDTIAAYTQGDFSSTYNKVEYRGFTYDKYLAPMEMMGVKLEQPAVSVHAWALNATGQRTPYALQSGNFWYVADLPFAYIHETDRYLVFADLLGPMLGSAKTCRPRALARMEDLSPRDSAPDLRRMLNALERLDIPFGAATIPVYRNAARDITRTWEQNPAALNQLNRIPAMKGRIFQHGYTHQYKSLKNPFGETGDDFEFWRASDNGIGGFNYLGPIRHLTPKLALERVQKGQAVLNELGLDPKVWVTPHYAANPTYYKNFNKVYPRVMERRLYKIGQTVAGQFFPYPTKDVYGTLVLPETLGSLQPGYPVERIMAAARANRALSCPWAGHFFHAYTINPQYEGENAISVRQFEQIFRDIQAMGYTYVDPLSVR